MLTLYEFDVCFFYYSPASLIRLEPPGQGLFIKGYINQIILRMMCNYTQRCAMARKYPSVGRDEVCPVTLGLTKGKELTPPSDRESQGQE